MALSFYTNWPNHDSDYTSLFRPPSPLPELLNLHEDFTFYDTEINHIFEPNLASPGYLSSPVTPTGNVITLLPEKQDFQGYTFNYQNPYYDFPREQFFPVEYTMPVVQLPENHQGGGCGGYNIPTWPTSTVLYDQESNNNNVKVKKQNVVGKNGGGGNISAQSKAARVRRRKISEKTSELGKLIPGGHKMSTAKMFRAAFKYIKFLQAQIGVLKFMASLPESEEVLNNGEMKALVTCPLMQEKLYNEEKCINWTRPVCGNPIKWRLT